MNNKTRSHNVKKNSVYSAVLQITALVLSFINRTVFVFFLSSEYLGVNGLFGNILTVLSLAELGVGTVMIYALYKPIADKDYDLISAYVNYFKKCYKWIGLIVLGLGLLLLPFLQFVVTGANIPLNEIRLFYIVYLLNTVFTYIGVYKQTLLNADQNTFVVKKWNFCFTVLMHVTQILTLFLFKNYLIYILVMMTSTLLNNIYVNLKTNKLYPFLKKEGNLSEKQKITIKEKVKATLVYKISITLMNNTDNILISIIVGTVFVGYYSNYSLIVGAITSLFTILVSVCTSSVGNLNASGNKVKLYRVFRMFVFAFHWIIMFCSICFFFLLNDFITLWLGTEYVLSFSILFAIVFYFYITNIVSPVYMYRESVGLFERTKYLNFAAMIINIILSIILGYIWGMFGILIATSIARIVTTVWKEPLILHREVFQKPSRYYFKQQLRYIIFTAIAFGVTYLCMIPFESIGVVNFIIKCFICLIVPNAIFLLFNFKSRYFKDFKEYLLNRN